MPLLLIEYIECAQENINYLKKQWGEKKRVNKEVNKINKENNKKNIYIFVFLLVSINLLHDAVCS